jgi:hypothetical protein
LIVKLLSNVGIVGALAFLGAMFWILRANWRALGPMVSPTNLSRAAWLLALAVFLFTNVLIAFPLAFGNFWLVLGMAISTGWKLVPPRDATEALEFHNGIVPAPFLSNEWDVH